MELWFDIDGFEGYQISTLGNVKSFKYNTQRIKKASVNKHGYKYVCLQSNGKQYSRKIHSLMAMVFFDYKIDGCQKLVVDHIDNDKLNNDIRNLRVVTNRENLSKGQKNKYSDKVGVSYNKRNKKYISQISYKGKLIYLGSFNNEIGASNAYQEKLEQIKNNVL